MSQAPSLASHTGQAPETSSFHAACHSIIETARATGTKALDYAVGYARAGLHLSTTEAIRTQSLYILNNITHWRGAEATKVRTTLKTITERNSQ